MHQRFHVRLAQAHQAHAHTAIEGIAAPVGRHVGQQEAVQAAWSAQIAGVAVRRLAPAVHYSRKPHLLTMHIIRGAFSFQRKVVPGLESHAELALRDLLEIGGDVRIQDVHRLGHAHGLRARRRPRTIRAPSGGTRAMSTAMSRSPSE